MTGYMWNVNWITKFRIIWPCVYFWKRRKKDTKYCMYICSVSNTLCLIYFYSTKKKFSTKAYISWQYRKKYIFPCFALVTVQSSWDIRRTRSELWRRTIQKKRRLARSSENLCWKRKWFSLLYTMVVCIFVWRQDYQLTQCLFGILSLKKTVMAKNCYCGYAVPSHVIHSLTIAFW